MVAAVGASKGAKRSAVIHLYFNLISSVVFLAGIYLIKCTIGVPFWNEILNKGSIANIHTLSSVVATICFIPFTKVLIWLAEHTVRDKPGEEQDLSMPVLDERLLTSPAVAHSAGPERGGEDGGPCRPQLPRRHAVAGRL